jgi:hypothetical protein
MNSHDLDALIDVAAQQIVRHEPAPSLSRAVMVRLHEDARPTSSTFAWAAAGAAAAVLIGLLAIVSSNRSVAPSADAPVASQPIAPAPKVQSLEPPRALLTKRPLTLSSAKRVLPKRRIDRNPPTAVLEDELFGSIAPIETPPIETQPIELQPLDVIPLASAATSIDPIEIPPLTIEPLSASND